MAQTPTTSPLVAAAPQSLRATMSGQRLILVVAAVMLGMLLALITTLFLREIPLRKSNAPGVPADGATPARGLDRTDALLGLTLAVVAREAQRPEASPRLLTTLSSLADGQLPDEWSTEQKSRAVAREVIQPLAAALLAASVAKGGD